MDAESLLEVHGEFESHQRVEPDLPDRPDPADFVLPRMQHPGQLGNDDTGQSAARGVDTWVLAMACRSRWPAPFRRSALSLRTRFA